MANRYQVTCITKSDRTNPHERITHIGGVGNGERWRLTLEEAIQGIKSGRWAFYVSQGGHTVDVIVARSRYGHDYLKTTADGEQPDNLLALPQCMG